MLSNLSPTAPVGGLTLRPEAEDGRDEAFLFALFASVKAPEMALMPIDDCARGYLLRMQYRSMTASYRAGSPECALRDRRDKIASRSAGWSPTFSQIMSITSMSRCCRTRAAGESAPR